MTPARPATVRIYFDADVLGLAKLLCRERVDFTYPGDRGGRIKKRHRPPCPVTAVATKDPDWIPIVAARGWVIITRDRHIQDKRAEIETVRRHGAKMVNLASQDAGTTWAQLEVFMRRWERDVRSRILPAHNPYRHPVPTPWNEVVHLRPLAPGDIPVLASWANDVAFCQAAAWSVDRPHEERVAFWRRLIRLAVIHEGAIAGYVDLRGSGPTRR